MFQQLPAATQRDLVAFMRSLVTADKRQRLDAALAARTNHLTVVIEDIFQPHNASAVLRTCECFGLSDVHIVEQHHRYRPNPDITMGAHKWLRLQRYRQAGHDNPRQCIERLRANGYRIIATALTDHAVTLDQLAIDDKCALCFGTEETGLSSAFLEAADATVTIPMYGFTQSLNISVSVAICLHQLRSRMLQNNIPPALGPQDHLELQYHWLLKILRHGPRVVKAYLGRN
jgi:tRNA (guanosine-2'-O-)-methyltransferase